MLFFASCNDSFLDESAKKEKSQQISEGFNVTLSDAIIYANVTSSEKGLSVEAIEPIVYEKDTLAYILNYTDGWEILSGDKRTAATLALDEIGEFSLESDNVGVMIWLDDMLNQIYNLRKFGKNDVGIENYTYWKELTQKKVSYMARNTNDQMLKSTTIDKPHLINTKWGQGQYWNVCVPYTSNLTDRCPVGCVAVAGAQMLYYLHYKLGTPSSMYSQGSCSGWSSKSGSSYSFSFSNPTTTVWNEMAKYYWNSGTDKSAILLGYVGWQVGMNYDEKRSSASTSDLEDDVFGALGISCDYNNYDNYTILSSLNGDMPVIIRADGTKVKHKFIFNWYTTYEDGHAWIIDGYYIDGSDTFWRMNWGWDGSYDSGKYLATASSDVDWEVLEYDENGKPKKYHFVYKRKILHGFSN